MSETNKKSFSISNNVPDKNRVYQDDAVFYAKKCKEKERYRGIKILELSNGTWYNGKIENVQLENFIIYNATASHRNLVKIINSTIKNGRFLCHTEYKVEFVNGSIVNSTVEEHKSLKKHYIEIENTNIYKSKIQSQLSDYIKNIVVSPEEKRSRLLRVSSCNVVQSSFYNVSCVGNFVKNCIVDGSYIHLSYLVNCTITNSTVEETNISNCIIADSQLVSSVLKKTTIDKHSMIEKSKISSCRVSQSKIVFSNISNSTLNKIYIFRSSCESNVAHSITFDQSIWLSGTWLDGRWHEGRWLGGSWKTGKILIWSSHRETTSVIKITSKQDRTIELVNMPGMYITSNCNPSLLASKLLTNGIPLVKDKHRIFIAARERNTERQIVKKISMLAQTC